jgi:hypothetical protein
MLADPPGHELASAPSPELRPLSQGNFASGNTAQPLRKV